MSAAPAGGKASAESSLVVMWTAGSVALGLGVGVLFWLTGPDFGARSTEARIFAGLIVLLFVLLFLFGGRFMVWWRHELRPLVAEPEKQRNAALQGVGVGLGFGGIYGLVAWFNERIPELSLESVPWQWGALAGLVGGIVYVAPATTNLRALYLISRNTGAAGGWGPADVRTAVDGYRLGRHRMRTMLAVMGFVLSLTVVTGGALIEAHNRAADSPVDTELFLVVYGLILTGGVALMYFPPHARLDASGEELVGSLVPLDAGPMPPSELEKALDARSALRTELGLGRSPAAALEGSIVVLGPLITAAISAFVAG